MTKVCYLPACSIDDHPDSEAICLWEEFERRWNCQRLYFEHGFEDDRADEFIIESTARAVDALEGVKAKSLDGLIAKARAVLWCHSGKLLDMRHERQDLRLAFGIIADLLDMGR